MKRRHLMLPLRDVESLRDLASDRPRDALDESLEKASIHLNLTDSELRALLDVASAALRFNNPGNKPNVLDLRLEDIIDVLNRAYAPEDEGPRRDDMRSDHAMLRST